MTVQRPHPKPHKDLTKAAQMPHNRNKVRVCFNTQIQISNHHFSLITFLTSIIHAEKEKKTLLLKILIGDNDVVLTLLLAK